ncbi:MAG: WbqC family protein [Bacteroidales bacterium]|nr:WbqC family protein [Bacteroidales bacterium]
MLLTTAYFPPIEYFSILARYSVVYLEAHEKYRKQSWRNRCRILTANGPMDLNFPIVHDGAGMIKDIRVDWSTPWLHKTEYAIDSAYYSSPFFEYYRDELFGILDSHPETLWDLNLGIIDFFCRKIGICPQIRETAEYVAPGGTVTVAGSPAGLAPGQLRTSCSSHRCAPLAVPPLTCPRVDTVSPEPDKPGLLSFIGGVEPPSKSANGIAVMEDRRYSIHPKLASGYVAEPYWQVFREKFGFVDGLSIMDLLFNEGPESLCYLK